MHLRTLLDGAAIDPAALVAVPDDRDWATVDVTDVVCDSRAARRGSLFCCIRGARADGHDHAPQAVAAGAVALVSEHRLRLGVPNVVVRSTAEVAGPLAASVQEHPSRALRVFAVTGTNGKTTTTYLLEAILAATEAASPAGARARASGRGVGVIGTVETRWPGTAEASPLTTPDACGLQALLARMRADGVTDVAMEVSSHALEQGRVLGCEFTAACFTNLSQDHLDYHGTMEAYAAAKRSLFTPRYTRVAVTNVSDDVGRSIASQAGELGLDVWTYGPHETSAHVTAIGASFTLHGLRCTISGARVPTPFDVEAPLVGAFNLENVLAAVTTALSAGVAPTTVAGALRSARPVPGRLEPVPNERGLHVFVDYAHTPDALARVLGALRAVAPAARLVVVYGAGGDRDRHKRPLMGRAVAGAADMAVLTSDNPRSEDPAAIAADVLHDLPQVHRPIVELDRRAAIARSLHEAQPGDVIVIAGKGHEHGQQIGDMIVPFDDVAVARELLGGAA